MQCGRSFRMGPDVVDVQTQRGRSVPLKLPNLKQLTSFSLRAFADERAIVSANRKGTIRFRALLPAIGTTGPFASLIDALHHSRSRQAERILRHYRYLIVNSNQSVAFSQLLNMDHDDAGH